MRNYYNYVNFNKQEMDVPGKNNQVYQDFLVELKAKYPELDCAGIYGIYFNKQLIYIGQATDINKRWVSHCFNWNHAFSESYKSSKYVALRHLAGLGLLEFAVIQKAEGADNKSIKAKLNTLEGHYIRKYMPLLNRQIPRENGYGYTEKHFTLRELMDVTGLDRSQIADMKAELLRYYK